MILFVGPIVLFKDQKEYVTKPKLLWAPTTVILQWKVQIF